MTQISFLWQSKEQQNLPKYWRGKGKKVARKEKGREEDKNPLDFLINSGIN